MSKDNLVEVTVSKKGTVHDGEGGICAVGKKIKVSADVARALRAKKWVK